MYCSASEAAVPDAWVGTASAARLAEMFTGEQSSMINPHIYMYFVSPRQRIII